MVFLVLSRGMTPVFRLGSAVVFATAMGMASGDPYAKLCAGDYD